jgi:1,2-diacylglycerol 3-alpha-glucosyltransferase
MTAGALKILVISGAFYPKIDGSVVAVTEVLRQFKALGHRFVLVTRGYRSVPNPNQVNRYNAVLVRQNGHSLISRILMVGGQIRISSAMMKEERFDVIHAHGFSSLLVGLVVGAAYRRPVVVTLHGLQNFWSRTWGLRWKLQFFFFLPFEAFLASRADAIVAQSNTLKRQISRIYRISPERVEVVSNPVDSVEFGYCEPSKSGLKVLFVGTLGRVHGPDLLIRAARLVKTSVPAAKFIIIGEGPAKARLTESAEAAGMKDEVEFVGRVTQRELLKSYYEACRVVVVPFKAEGYILSLVALEGMAVGRPVLTTMIVDAPEGVIRALYTEESLADGIVRILSMPEQSYRKLSRACRGYVERECDSKIVAERTTNVYRKLVRKNENQDSQYPNEQGCVAEGDEKTVVVSHAA